MNMRLRGGFDFGDFEITRKEIIASISIVVVMLMIGIGVSGKISEYQMDKNEIYNKAVKIESTDLFQYGMDTNVGNAFVYGELKAVDTVTYPEIGGEYMYVEKVKEKYTNHTRTVTKTRVVNGKTQTYTETETYWTWDRVGSEDKKCNEVAFCGITFNVSKFDIPSTHHIDTIKESSHIRYKYYGVGTEFVGTIFADLRDKTIADNTSFYEEMSIEQTYELLKCSGGEIIFWIFWTILTGVCIYGFFYLDNRWLE